MFTLPTFLKTGICTQCIFKPMHLLKSAKLFDLKNHEVAKRFRILL